MVLVAGGCGPYPDTAFPNRYREGASFAPTEVALPGLSDIRVLDLSQGVAGGFCARLFGELGADVIKVEPPGGDPLRAEPPFLGGVPHPERSALHLYVNMNKRGVTLDPRTERGRALLDRLAEGRELIVHSYRRGEAAALGLDAAGAERRGAVICAVTPFGHTGPYADWEADDFVVYALCGAMYVTGDQDREPLTVYGHVPSYQGGLTASVASLAALLHRQEGGPAQFIDVSLVEMGATTLEAFFARWTYSREAPQRSGNSVQGARAGLDYFPAADGMVAVASVLETQWRGFCTLVGHPEWIDDPALATHEQRQERAAEINAAAAAWFRSRRAEEAMAEGQAARVPTFALRTLEALMEDPQVRHRGFFVSVDHPVVGSQLVPGFATDFGEMVQRCRRAPLLGEHNEEVFLGELGMDRGELDELRAEGVV